MDGISSTYNTWILWLNIFLYLLFSYVLLSYRLWQRIVKKTTEWKKIYQGTKLNHWIVFIDEKISYTSHDGSFCTLYHHGLFLQLRLWISFAIQFFNCATLFVYLLLYIAGFWKKILTLFGWMNIHSRMWTDTLPVDQKQLVSSFLTKNEIHSMHERDILLYYIVQSVASFLLKNGIRGTNGRQAVRILWN